MNKRVCLFLGLLIWVLLLCSCGESSIENSNTPSLEQLEPEKTVSLSADRIEEPDQVSDTAIPLSDSDFVNNLKRGLQARWDITGPEEEMNATSEEDASRFINDTVGAERNCLGEFSDYSFKDKTIKNLADEYFVTLLRTEQYYKGALVDNDEHSQTKLIEASIQRQEIITKFVDLFGLEVDEQYEDDLEHYLNMHIALFRSTDKSGSEIDGKIAGEELIVRKVNLYTEEKPFETLACPIVVNNSDKKLVTAGICFAAWDENDRPVTLYTDEDSAQYYDEYMEYEDINLPPGEESDGEMGIVLDCSIRNIKRIGAVVVFGEYDDGTRYDNPYVERWQETYCGQVYKGEDSVATDSDIQIDIPKDSNQPELQEIDSNTGITKTDKSSDNNDNGGADGEAQDNSVRPNDSDEPSVTVPDHEESSGHLVWVPTNGGTKYHSNSHCSKMVDPMQVSIETAEANGYTPCQRCY